MLTLPATELSVLLRTKQLSSSELVEASIQRIEALNPILNAVVTDNFAAARKVAKKADKAIKDGDELGLLHGLPVGVKDLEVTKGLRTTFGSLLFAENIPDRDQSSVVALHREGGIIIGKTNTPEFGA
ncbi:MAG: amidase family protein, partial [Candidatus Puniceispirillaceae bacterium]